MADNDGNDGRKREDAPFFPFADVPTLKFDELAITFEPEGPDPDEPLNLSKAKIKDGVVSSNMDTLPKYEHKNSYDVNPNLSEEEVFRRFDDILASDKE